MTELRSLSATAELIVSWFGQYWCMRDNGGDENGEEDGVCRDWMWKKMKRTAQVANMKMESLGE